MMSSSKMIHKSLPIIAIGLSALVVGGCERPAQESVQRGFRGVAFEQVINPRLYKATAEEQAVVPDPIPPASEGGKKASVAYKNVQVLKDLTENEFLRLMTAMTQWVGGEKGCFYCHESAQWELDDVYTKTVTRSMIQMTQDTNANWKSHVADTGVTCYTCHRGKGVPEYVWSKESTPDLPAFVKAAGQNTPSETVAYASLPYDVLTPYLEDDKDIKVVSHTVLPQEGHFLSIKETEASYGLMMYVSDSLGVNCTYCHNTRSFFSWDQSAPQRTVAWHAIRHVRSMNNDYINPLADILPDDRKGPEGDPLKVGCMTCHQGVFKPLYGAPMLKDYPSLAGPTGGSAPVAAAPSAPEPVAEEAAADEPAPQG